MKAKIFYLLFYMAGILTGVYLHEWLSRPRTVVSVEVEKTKRGSSVQLELPGVIKHGVDTLTRRERRRLQRDAKKND